MGVFFLQFVVYNGQSILGRMLLRDNVRYRILNSLGESVRKPPSNPILPQDIEAILETSHNIMRQDHFEKQFSDGLGGAMKKFSLSIVIVFLILCTIACAEDKPFISKGDYGDEVILLHRKMSEIGIFTLRAESPFGPMSVEALKTIQDYLGVEASGGIRTREEFDTILSIDTDEIRSELEKIPGLLNPYVVEQTESISVKMNEQFTLHVEAIGMEPLAYQWQFATAGSEVFKNSSSGESKFADWTMQMTPSIDGRLYRCYISDAYGRNTISESIEISLLQ